MSCRVMGALPPNPLWLATLDLGVGPILLCRDLLDLLVKGEKVSKS